LSTDGFQRYSLKFKPTAGTCEWIEQRRKFQHWQDRNSDENKLWIYGDPGCGKTYIAKHIIRLEGKTKVVAECFLDASLEERRGLQAILRLTLRQALKSYPDLIRMFLVPGYQKREGDKVVWTTDDLSSVWPTAIIEVTKRCSLAIIIDGFDECEKENQEAFLNCFKEYEDLLRGTRSLKLLILSRHSSVLERHFAESSRYGITARDTLNDISTTVKRGLEGFVDVVGYSPKLKNRLCKEIPEGAKGMYLWATLIVADLEHTIPTERNVEKQLENLPKGIAELYDSILGRMKDIQPFVKSVLMWVVFRLELLKTQELGVGLALSECGDPSVIEEAGLEACTLPSVKATVFHFCGQLVKFSAGNVDLVHRTLARFLTTPTATMMLENDNNIKIPHHEKYYLDIRRSNETLGDLCVAYLLLPYFAHSGAKFNPKGPGPTQWEQKVLDRVNSYEFANYAALSWARHLKDGGRTFSRQLAGPRDQRILTNLTNPNTQYAICWTEVWWLARRWPRLPYPVDDLRMSEFLPSDELDPNAARNGQTSPQSSPGTGATREFTPEATTGTRSGSSAGAAPRGTLESTPLTSLPTTPGASAGTTPEVTPGTSPGTTPGTGPRTTPGTTPGKGSEISGEPTEYGFAGGASGSASQGRSDTGELNPKAPAGTSGYPPVQTRVGGVVDETDDQGNSNRSTNRHSVQPPNDYPNHGPDRSRESDSRNDRAIHPQRQSEQHSARPAPDQGSTYPGGPGRHRDGRTDRTSFANPGSQEYRTLDGGRHRSEVYIGEEPSGGGRGSSRNSEYHKDMVDDPIHEDTRQNPDERSNTSQPSKHGNKLPVSPQGIKVTRLTHPENAENTNSTVDPWETETKPQIPLETTPESTNWRARETTPPSALRGRTPSPDPGAAKGRSSTPPNATSESSARPTSPLNPPHKETRDKKDPENFQKPLAVPPSSNPAPRLPRKWTRPEKVSRSPNSFYRWWFSPEVLSLHGRQKIR
jgi:hypothetical protein